MNKIFLRGQIRELRGVDVAALIGARRFSEISAIDEQPFFVEMVVAHEGESRGEVVGFGARVKEWTKRVIRELVSAFDPSGRVPAKLFDGFVNWHGNESVRVPVGEVVHSRVRELAGVSAAETIGWIFPEQTELKDAIRRGDRDCCSIEADVILSSDLPAGRVVVDAIERASGIVLGHTSKQTPGFAGATVRALCEFEPDEEASSEQKAVSSEQTEQSTQYPTKDDVMGWVKEGLAAATAAQSQAVQQSQQEQSQKITTPPAPSEKQSNQTETQSFIDLTDPKQNEFLPV